MANPTITGNGPNSRTNLKNIHSGKRSFQKDLATTHSQIALMQSALTKQGYDTKGADGKFGDNTLSAVKAFQRAKGLTADGYFGKNSLLALESMLGKHLDPTVGGCVDGSDSGDTGGTGSNPEPDDGNSDYYYGTVNVSTVNIRNATVNGSILGKWPRNRIGIVKPYNDVWYQTFWKGNSAFVQRKFIDLGTKASNDMPTRMAYIAEQEVGQKNHTYYYAPTEDSNGGKPKWCQYFVNWLAKHAGMPAANVPDTASTPKAIEWFLKNGVTFRFVNATNKAKMREYGAVANYTVSGLTSAETAFRPQMGDFVFFRFVTTDHCSHVGFVQNYNSTTGMIHTIEGNKSDKVGERDIAYNDSTIVGYGRLNY